MAKFKVGDVFEYHSRSVSSDVWRARNGSIGIIIACNYDGIIGLYDVNWIIDTAPHLKNRAAHPAYDNRLLLDGSTLITHAEVVDDGAV